ncbi:MAG: CobW family GTP-binding protein [Lachnospirales bacterium]
MKQLILITGFLGSGKTTFLENILQQSIKKTGVLMNEFGSISIDTDTIIANKVELKELTNGSIFCSCLKEQFIDGLIELLNVEDIDIIFVESSGISDPSDIGKIIDIIKIKDPLLQFDFAGTICIVDGLHFLKTYEKMVSVQRQIKHSHKIIINKMDLIEKDTYSEIIKTIRNINSKVEIISTCHSKISYNELFPKYFKIENEETTNTISTRTKSIILSIENTEKINIEELLKMLKDISPHFYRTKGYINIKDRIFKIDQINNEVYIQTQDLTLDKIKSINKIVFLSSRSLQSIKAVTDAANKYLNKSGYKITM